MPSAPPSAERLPDDLRLIPFDAAHHDAVVLWENRFLPPSQQWTPERSKRLDREHPDVQKVRLIVVDRDDRIVATAFARSAEIVGKAGGAYAVFARVDPAWQRRGIGSRLLDYMEGHARASGAPRALTLTYANETAGLAFLDKRGYQEYSRRTRWSLRLSAFDAGRYPSVDDIAREAGVEIFTLADAIVRVPDAARQVYDVHGAILDELPLPLRPNRLTFERYAAQLDDPEIEKRASAVALRGDRIVGLHLVALLDNGIASSLVTGTVGEGRGKRLGLALKLHALDALKVTGRDIVATLNDADNAPTLRILRTLGYEPEPAMVRLRKDLAPD
jgi:GNAT superfamily N-acetyltransferase